MATEIAQKSGISIVVFYEKLYIKNEKKNIKTKHRNH